jgi:hypothetical protein
MRTAAADTITIARAKPSPADNSRGLPISARITAPIEQSSSGSSGEANKLGGEKVEGDHERYQHNLRQKGIKSI